MKKAHKYPSSYYTWDGCSFSESWWSSFVTYKKRFYSKGSNSSAVCEGVPSKAEALLHLIVLMTKIVSYLVNVIHRIIERLTTTWNFFHVAINGREMVVIFQPPDCGNGLCLVWGATFYSIASRYNSDIQAKVSNYQIKAALGPDIGASKITARRYKFD